MKLPLFIFLITILFLSSCTFSSEDSSLQLTNETENESLEIQNDSLEIIAQIEETKIEAGDIDKSTLYIQGEDWVTLIDLSGFSYESGLDGPYTDFSSRFLIQKSASNMTISIFAEKVEGVDDSASCLRYYLPTIQESRDKSELILSTMGTDFIVSDVEQENNFILTWVADINFPSLKGKIKQFNHYRYYDGYCFDFHISQTGYQDDDGPFYDIINSIQFEEGIPLEDASDVYTISP